MVSCSRLCDRDDGRGSDGSNRGGMGDRGVINRRCCDLGWVIEIFLKLTSSLSVGVAFGRFD
jgi:hypothetical protein